jgi:Sec-independent protein secretion pathway component TatC
MAIPLMGLFELSIWLTGVVERQRARELAAEERREAKERATREAQATPEAASAEPPAGPNPE